MTDERMKELMAQVGMPDSCSIAQLILQVENEAAFEYTVKANAEISRLQAENERLKKWVLDPIDLVSEYAKVSQQLRTAEQRVARDCMELMKEAYPKSGCYHIIKAKYGL